MQISYAGVGLLTRTPSTGKKHFIHVRMGTVQSSLLLVRDTQNKGLTANSGRFFSRFSSPPSKIVAREVRRTLEKTSSCWQAVDTLVISPWYPASEISYDTKARSRRARRRAASAPPAGSLLFAGRPGKPCSQLSDLYSNPGLATDQACGPD